MKFRLSFKPFGGLIRQLSDRWGSDDLRLPVLGSAILHLLLLLGLFVVMPGHVEERRVNPTPNFVTAKVVTVAPKEKPKPKRSAPKKKPPKKKPVKKAAPNKPVMKPKPKPDQKTIALKKKQLDEQRKKELADKARREKEAREEKERLERLQKQSEQEMLASLAREEQARNQVEADQVEVASYAGIIRQRVEEMWTRPLSARKGMSVTIRIRLTPTGEVISTGWIKRSGDDAFDQSAIQAIERAKPFTELQGMESRIFEQNFREFRFVFNPEDLLE